MLGLIRAAGLLACIAIVGAGVFGCSDDGQAGLDGTRWTLAGWPISSLYPGAADSEAASAGGFSTGELARTLMAGPEPAMRAEDVFFQLLSGARTYSLADGKLTLCDANGNQ